MFEFSPGIDCGVFLSFFLLRAAYMVFRNIEKSYTVAPGSRSRLPWAVSVAHFDRYFSYFTAILSLRDVV